MRVKTTEKIIINREERDLWNDFDRLIGVMCSEATIEEILDLIDDLQKLMSYLEEYLEEE